MHPLQVGQLLSEHGTLRPQSERDWTGPFELPQQLSAFYQEVGPHDLRIRGYGNPYFLPALAGLWDFQAGYRWNALTRERVPDWNDDWLVVAAEDGDAFILSRSTGVILFARHGQGVWRPGEIFPDVNAMAACLASLGSIIRDAGATFTDDDSLIRPEHRVRATHQVSAILGSDVLAADVLSTLGW